MAHSIGNVVRYGGRHYDRHYARGGVFVVCFVVDDDKDDAILSLLRPRRRLVVCFVVDDNEDDTKSIMLRLRRRLRRSLRRQ